MTNHVVIHILEVADTSGAVENFYFVNQSLPLLEMKDFINQMASGMRRSFIPESARWRVVHSSTYAPRFTEEDLESLKEKLVAQLKCINWGALYEGSVEERNRATTMATTANQLYTQLCHAITAPKATKLWNANTPVFANKVPG